MGAEAREGARALATVLLVAAAVGAASTARADDTMLEGAQALYGVRGDRRQQIELRSDLAVVPYPLGAEFWGGPINATRVEATLGVGAGLGPNVDAARVQLVRWPHLHALGVERDVRQGAPWALELFGAYLPLRLWGRLGGRSWGFVLAGANVGARSVAKSFGGVESGWLGTVSPSAHLEARVPLSHALDLRVSGDTAYLAGLGRVHGGSAVWGAHLIALSAGAILACDVSSTPRTQPVVRRDPTSGELYEREVATQGQRTRLHLIGLVAEVRPIDTLTTAGALVRAHVGIEHAF